MTSRFFTLLALPLLAIGLTACGDLVGSKAMPDEMAVVEGPPLVVPPHFDLRPPEEAAAEKQKAEADASAKQAEKILAGQSTQPAAAAPVPADDAWLVKQAGGDSADPTIRQQLQQENPTPQPAEKKKKGFFGRLFD